VTALRIGTRGSALAVAQSTLVKDRLAQATGQEVELVTVTSEGDRSTESLATLGGTGVFASALREAGSSSGPSPPGPMLAMRSAPATD
jgi:hydroxymethylbilane synthase